MHGMYIDLAKGTDNSVPTLALTWHVVLNRVVRASRFPLADVQGLQSARRLRAAVCAHDDHHFGEWLLPGKILTVKTRRRSGGNRDEKGSHPPFSAEQPRARC